MSNAFVAVYRDKTGIKHSVPFERLDNAMSFLRARIERMQDVLNGLEPSKNTSRCTRSRRR